MLYDAGGTEICVHVYKNNVGNGSLSSFIYRAETKNAGTPDWSRSKLQKERNTCQELIQGRYYVKFDGNWITALPADAWFAARLLPKFFRFDSLAILEPNYTSKEQRLIHFFFFEKKSKSLKNQMFSNRTFF